MLLNPQKPSQGLLFQQIIVLFFVFVVSLGILFTLLSLTLGMGPDELATDLGGQFFYCYVVQTDQTLGKLGEYSIILLLYILALITGGIYYLLRFAKRICGLSIEILPPQQALPLLGLILAFLTLTLQTSQQFCLFQYMRERHANKTKEEGIEYIFDDHYKFSQYCKSIFPGFYTADFYTDIKDEPPDDAMTAQRMVSYFLYPHIDIRINRDQPKDCIILYFVSNAQAYVPQDYQIIGTYKKYCHLAVRRDLIHDE